MRRIKHFAGLFTVCVILGCATVPITGRSQFSIIPAVQMISMSTDSFNKLIQESKLSADQDKIKMVERVGERVARATEEFLWEMGRGSDIKNFDWEFKLIQDDENVNAFAMPGGKVGVYTGILRVAQDEAGLATVMAHEIGHVIANHGGERMSQLLLVQLGGVTLNAALKNETEKTRYWWLIAYGAGTTLGYVLPYSRLQESESDRIGLILMARAGYDPSAAVAFWERMNQESKARMPQFLSTHPAPSTRIAEIQKRIPEAKVYYKP